MFDFMFIIAALIVFYQKTICVIKKGKHKVPVINEYEVLGKAVRDVQILAKSPIIFIIPVNICITSTNSEKV
ncbi:hypothetical protein ACFLQ5_02415 [Bacteroidota bacterium]